MTLTRSDSKRQPPPALEPAGPQFCGDCNCVLGEEEHADGCLNSDQPMLQIHPVLFRKHHAFIVTRRYSLLDEKHNKEKYNIYGIRHSEADWDYPMSVEEYVLCNRWGFLLTDKQDPISELTRTPTTSNPLFIILTKDEKETFNNATQS